MTEARLYNSYSSYLTGLFGGRVQKISLDAGMSCPNRDGSKGRGGCIYCDQRGSGTGVYARTPSIREQILRGKQFLKDRYKAEKFIAYFQSFSNTYAPLETLKALYEEALSEEDVVGLAVGTRPDCVNAEILDLIAGFQKTHLVWMEYGLQSFLPRTLDLINRGHTVEDFLEAVGETRKRGLLICVHVILGLPGEGLKDCLSTATRLGELDIQGLKIHSLYINKGTLLEGWYRQGRYKPLTQEEYVDWVCRFLEQCPPHWIIQRLTGDPDPAVLIDPQWTLNKQQTLKMIQERLKADGGFQGARWKEEVSRFKE
ncbi:MAG: TIGR01212 family radical SAM protein [Thermodesulfobacteriota bacterium]